MTLKNKMTLMNNESEWNKGIELRKIYNEGFSPLILEEDYGAAFEFLLHHKEIKSYLKPCEIHSMYDFLESMCFDLAIMVNEPDVNVEKIIERLKGLEGKTN
jgi:hypothetical protein